jgi:hypothetical protein
VTRFVITFVIKLPALTFPASHPQASTSLPPLASRVFATAIRFPSFSHSSSSYRTRLHTLFFFSLSSFDQVVSKNGQTHQDSRYQPRNIKFTLLLQAFSFARFTYGSQRYVVLERPRFVHLTKIALSFPHLGTRRHRLPRHRPDFILIPAPDGMCSLPLIAAIH